MSQTPVQVPFVIGVAGLAILLWLMVYKPGV